MKKEDVPQDLSSLGKITKEVCYATDATGKYTTELSKGWDVKITALDTAWNQIDERIKLAYSKVINNEASPLLYYMEKALMDVKILADYSGFWQWQVKNHLKTGSFKNLPDKKLERYAKVFNITVAELKNIRRMELSFEHLQSAHCENGVTRSLLKDIGVKQITEPLAFGIGAGLYYVYIPLLKINNGPVIAFRPLPGLVFKRTCNALGIEIVRKKFRSREKAAAFLDKSLTEGHAVGCQVGVYYLPYFPKEYRFHFNAHNLIVYGREGDNYLVSDPVMELTAKLTSYELERVRFAKGALAPNGQLYYPKKGAIVTDDIIRKAIINGIKRNTSTMLKPIVRFTGIDGIRFTAGRVKQWRDKLGLKQAGLYLAQLVRMQEEIGTGGGGFRYIYGAFLQEAHQYIPENKLMEISAMFTSSGDVWRSAAVQAAGIYKGRLGSQEDFNMMADYLMEVADIETQAFKALKNIQWN